MMHYGLQSLSLLFEEIKSKGIENKYYKDDKEKRLIISTAISESVINVITSCFDKQEGYSNLQLFMTDVTKYFAFCGKLLPGNGSKKNLNDFLAFLKDIGNTIKNSMTMISIDIDTALKKFVETNTKKHRMQPGKTDRFSGWFKDLFNEAKKNDQIKSIIALYDIYDKTFTHYFNKYIMQKGPKGRDAYLAKIIDKTKYYSGLMNGKFYPRQFEDEADEEDDIPNLSESDLATEKSSPGKSQSPAKKNGSDLGQKDVEGLPVTKMQENGEIDQELNEEVEFDQIEQPQASPGKIPASNSLPSHLVQNIMMKIITGVGFVLSANHSKRIIDTMAGDDEGGGLSTSDFTKPHVIQILGLMFCLGLGDTKEPLKNRYVGRADPPILGSYIRDFMSKTKNSIGEILTGQGKSWAISFLASFFALMRYDVVIACYSRYLTDRDQESFNKNLHQFHFCEDGDQDYGSVKYEILAKTCEEKLKIPTVGTVARPKGGFTTLRDIVSNVIADTKHDADFWDDIETLDTECSDGQHDKEIIFIIDEVDVLLCEKITETHNMSSVPAIGTRIASLQRTIWKAVQDDYKNDPAKLKKIFDSKLIHDDTLYQESY